MSINKVSNSQLFLIFLKIGSLAFGGFMSLIAIIEKVVVEEKKWLKSEDILDGISLASILPGPVAVNVVTYTGYKINGFKGAICSFFGIIIPSFLMILILGDLYLKYSDTVIVQSFFKGIMLAVSAIIFQVSYKMFKKSVSNKLDIGLVVFAFVIIAFTPQSIKIYVSLFIFLFHGFIGYFKSRNENSSTNLTNKLNVNKIVLPSVGLIVILVLSILPIPFTIGSLEHLFIKFGGLGLMLFGGGYVFIPLIQDFVVTQYQWITEQTFIDAIAMGQITPGPIVITIAFIGYKVNGILGAIVATLGIFGTPASLMLIATNLLDYFKQSNKVKSIIGKIRLGVIGMIAYAGFYILLSAFKNVEVIEPILFFKIAFMFALCILALIKYKLQVLWVIPLAGVIGYFVF